MHVMVANWEGILCHLVGSFRYRTRNQAHGDPPGPATAHDAASFVAASFSKIER